MAKHGQTAKIKVHKEPGNSKIKRIEIGGFSGTTRMGIHGDVASFFKLSPDEPLPSTLDYVVAAVGGCLTGTIAGALEARGIATDAERLETEAQGTLEEIDGKLLLTQITVRYKLKIPKESRAAVDRALEHHASRCPVSESVKRGIKVEWQSEIVEQ